MAEETKKKFLIHGGILAIAGILVRIIGMLYRIPMVNIIGSEGNGIYGAAFNVYNIILVLSSYGLPMAVSKLISAKFVMRKYRNAAEILKCAMIVAICTGGIAGMFLFFGSDAIESIFYKGVPGMAIPLKILAPTVFIVALMGVLRGFYQGQGTTIPTAVSQLIEQVVNAVVSILAGYILINVYKESKNASAYGAAGGTLGTCIGAFSALVFLVVIYVIYRPMFRRMIRKDKVSDYQEKSDIYRKIALTMIPIILSQTFYQISAVIDDIMFNSMMVGRNITNNIAVDMGNFNTSYTLLIGIPQGVAAALSSAMLPSIVASFVKNDVDSVKSKLSDTLKTNMFIAIPSFVGLTVLGGPIVKMLFPKYDSQQGAIMLYIGAIAVVFYTLSTVTSSALQGIDKMNTPVKHACISLVAHIILVFALLKFSNLGIYAIVIGNASFPVLIFILNFIKLNKYIGYRMEYFKTILVPLICSVFMGVVSFALYKGIYTIIPKNTVALIITLAAAVVSYFGSIIIFRKKGMY